MKKKDLIKELDKFKRDVNETGKKILTCPKTTYETSVHMQRICAHLNDLTDLIQDNIRSRL